MGYLSAVLTRVPTIFSLFLFYILRPESLLSDNNDPLELPCGKTTILCTCYSEFSYHQSTIPASASRTRHTGENGQHDPACTKMVMGAWRTKFLDGRIGHQVLASCNICKATKREHSHLGQHMQKIEKESGCGSELESGHASAVR